MSLKKINLLFKTIIIILGISGLVLLLVVAPKIDNYLVGSHASIFIKGLFWITSMPVIYILSLLWKMSNEVAQEIIFTGENSSRLIRVAYAGLAESGIYAIAIIIGLFLLKDNYPYFFICSFFFLLGLIIAIISSLLSYIVKMASSIKDENDLTI